MIGATSEAQPLLDAAGVDPDEGVIVGSHANMFISAAEKGRIWAREPKVRTTY